MADEQNRLARIDLPFGSVVEDELRTHWCAMWRCTANQVHKVRLDPEHLVFTHNRDDGTFYCKLNIITKQRGLEHIVDPHITVAYRVVQQDWGLFWKAKAKACAHLTPRWATMLLRGREGRGRWDLDPRCETYSVLSMVKEDLLAYGAVDFDRDTPWDMHLTWRNLMGHEEEPSDHEIPPHRMFPAAAQPERELRTM